MTKEEFGQKLYEEMRSRGWNEDKLAQKARINVDYVGEYLDGLVFPNSVHLVQLADALGLKPKELLPAADIEVLEEKALGVSNEGALPTREQEIDAAIKYQENRIADAQNHLANVLCDVVSPRDANRIGLAINRLIETKFDYYRTVQDSS
ncbi:hypothetical protein RA28_04580 [Ruegeria sp. ANG-S4]|uniref:helix-turn-helix domain-containing protein n=1 Tax=Ruegeria sp. ANG-S4 TaxID=1577904 RepID=UPI00057DD64C|nr:helix-turn-helix transcriptional regulator [Ruegeria sp. ANG-S4]KIC46998.1 hypothetical protein RA28_04580 [Ruegeria sp. ANG-S4]